MLDAVALEVQGLAVATKDAAHHGDAASGPGRTVAGGTKVLVAVQPDPRFLVQGVGFPVAAQSDQCECVAVDAGERLVVVPYVVRAGPGLSRLGTESQT